MTMTYYTLGNSGLKVSRLALGCMSYGDPATPGAHPWALTEDLAQPYFRQAVELGGWTRFVSMQNQYNLLRRHDERELMAMCGDMGVGLVPYSPNAKGVLVLGMVAR